MTYIIQLQNKTEIEIDDADYQKFKQGAANGNFVQLKKGMVNPSFVICIIPASVKASRKIEGYIDEVSGKYIVTKYDKEPYKLVDEFSDNKKLN